MKFKVPGAEVNLMLCSQIQSFCSCPGKVLLVQMRRASQGCFGVFLTSLSLGRVGGDDGMSRLVGMALAELFLFVLSCGHPPPSQRLDCTTWQS